MYLRDTALATFRYLCHHFSAIVLLPVAILSTVRDLRFAWSQKGKLWLCRLFHQACVQVSLHPLLELPGSQTCTDTCADHS